MQATSGGGAGASVTGDKLSLVSLHTLLSAAGGAPRPRARQRHDFLTADSPLIGRLSVVPNCDRPIRYGMTRVDHIPAVASTPVNEVNSASGSGVCASLSSPELSGEGAKAEAAPASPEPQPNAPSESSSDTGVIK